MDSAGGGFPADYREAFLDLTQEAFAKVGEGRKTVSQATDSMSPLLRGGEEIVWVRSGIQPRFGDLLVFFRRHGCVVHRLVWKGRKGDLWTKGDNRLGFDAEPLGRGLPVGVVTTINHRGRSLILKSAAFRLHARLAAAVSLLGGILAVPCAWSDGVWRRVLFRRREVRAFRKLGWRVQRAGQLALYRVFFPGLRPGPVRED